MAHSKGARQHGRPNRLADMSKPPEERRRRKPGKPKAGKRKRAQMDHGTGSKAAKLRRDGKKWLSR